MRYADRPMSSTALPRLPWFNAPLNRALPLTLLLGGSLLLTACENAEPPKAAEPPSVIAEAAKQELVEDSTSYVGRIVAINKVELRARVEGFLKERKFTEGDSVDANQVLFVIEPDQYQAIVEQRQADLASAEASELNASAQLKRGKELLKDKNIAQSQVDELQAAESVALANIQQAQAALNADLLNLSYTQITAPVAGRVGLATYTIGNLVGPDSGTLATLVSRDPIYVQFPVTQRELLEARREIETRGGNARDVQVAIELPDGSRYPQTGHLDFVDVTTNQTTDTITLRGELPNPQGLLIDGQFVNLSLMLGDPKEALMIPQSALQVDQQGVYILVVDSDNKAQVRRVETGPTNGGDVAITKGLKAGELVIVEGIQKVRPGEAVKAAPPQPVTAEQGAQPAGDQPDNADAEASVQNQDAAENKNTGEPAHPDPQQALDDQASADQSSTPTADATEAATAEPDADANGPATSGEAAGETANADTNTDVDDAAQQATEKSQEVNAL